MATYYVTFNDGLPEKVLLARAQEVQIAPSLDDRATDEAFTE